MAAKFVEHSFKIGKSTVKCAAEVKGREILPMMKMANGHIVTLGAGSKPELADDKGAVPATLADVKACVIAGLMGESKGLDGHAAACEWADMQGQPRPPEPKKPAEKS